MSPASPPTAVTARWAGSPPAAPSASPSPPLMVTAVIATGGLRWTPLLVLPALAGTSLCLPVVHALQKRTAGPGTAFRPGHDDTASFVKLSLAVVFRSVTFVGLSTFIALYARQRLDGSTAAGTAALTVLYLGGAVGSLLGPGHGRPLVVRPHRRIRRGSRVDTGPGALPVRGPHLDRPVRPLLPPGHPRPGLPPQPRRHRRRHHPRPDRQRRRARWPGHRGARPTARPSRPRWPRSP